MTGRVVMWLGAIGVLVLVAGADVTGGGLWALGFAMGFCTGVALVAFAVAVHGRRTE